MSLILYGITLIIAPFTFFLDQFGTGIASFYVSLNYYEILIGGGAVQGVLFIFTLVAVIYYSDTSYIPLVYFIGWFGPVIGFYVLYGLLWPYFVGFYEQAIYTTMLNEKYETTQVEVEFSSL